MFRDDFVWGVASSAYQIEGMSKDDGHGETIWEDFFDEGKGFGSDNGKVTCDHLNRYKEDIALMKNMGIKAYRFSISWSRIMPEGVGKVNQKAIDTYRDMILTMHENGITPYITLFHWEFPKALYHKGGWLNRDVVEWFGEYAKVVAENFSDICENFITINEPQCVISLGLLNGVHAPGLKLSVKDTFLATHHLLMAHGNAVINLRKYSKRDIKIGFAPTGGVAYPFTDSKEDIEAAKKVYFGFYNPIDNWAWNVSWFSDPVFLGSYPKEGIEKYEDYLPEITKEDMELIHQPLDFMGQNIYNGYYVRAGKDGEIEFVNRKPGYTKTAVDWPVTPEAFYYGIKFLTERYPLPLYITENGMACHDSISPDGRIHDNDRINFLDSYIYAMQRAVDEGANVKGYFTWTFLDNLEWEKGFTSRFGLVYVDFLTQQRIVKDSGFWYQEVIEMNGRNLSGNQADENIIFLDPVCTHNIWGGSRLREQFGYKYQGDDLGECWGISAHPNGDGTVKFGKFAGKKLSQMWNEHPELFGNLDYDRFPLLIKIIDAKSDLSIQVHPNDEYAKVHENGSFGKTECWYVLDGPDDAALVIGHNARTKEELDSMIDEGRWSEFIREIPVKKGDFIQIDPGTVHAIKGGLLILETQQNSDITYRVYDYDRLSNGKPRELHISQSKDVITVPAAPVEESIIDTDCGDKVNELVTLYSCKYYTVFKMSLDGKAQFEQEYPFLNVTITDGSGIINGNPVNKGDHMIIPNGFGTVQMQGKFEMIASTVVK